MISSVSSYDDELLNSAYANISLIADKTWAFDQEDPFRKLNHTLWVQNYRLTAKYRENSNYQPKRVHDTIPQSRLAQYGNYEYNEERERMYKPSDATPVVHTLYTSETTEPWMFNEVEEHFARLSSQTSLPLGQESFSQLQNSATEGLEPAAKLKDRGTKWILRSKWDNTLRKQYANLESVLTVKSTSGKSSKFYPLQNSNKKEQCSMKIESEDCRRYTPPHYNVDNVAEMQLQIRITSDAVRDLWNPAKSQQRPRYGPRQQQRQQYNQQQQQCSQCIQQSQHLQYNLQHQPLFIKIGRQSSCPEAIGIMRRPPPPILSAEVPEFFPKGPGLYVNGHQEQAVPLQFFPSSAERSYQDELFPYNRVHVPNTSTIFQNASVSMPPPPGTRSLIRTPQQWIQRTGPPLQVQIPFCPPPQPICSSIQPICPTVVQRPLQLHEKVLPPNHMAPAPIPVYQRPPELYQDPSQRRKNQGVDYNNLILLTKNAMKSRRNQTKSHQHSGSFILESRQPNLRSESDVLQWLDKGYPKRAEAFGTVNTLISEFQDFGDRCDCAKATTWKSDPDVQYEGLKSTTMENVSTKFCDGDARTGVSAKKRLYRDVLANTSSAGIILENVFDRRYDELERQAMEQYRTSEECLALRYQELERQAMEQYRNSNNGAGSVNNIKETDLTSTTVMRREQQNDNKFVPDDRNCVGGHNCSGSGQCGSVKQHSLDGDKGTSLHQQIIILKPENKHGSSNPAHRGAHHRSVRPTVVTKSLTTMNQKFSRDSKNTIKGASGDKVDNTVQTSTKRRLILVSPLNRESGTRLQIKTSDLEETFQPISGHVSYRIPEVVQTGGGDERVTIFRSSEAEGIRKQLFLTDEELMDGSSESLGVQLLESTQSNGPNMKVDVQLNVEEKINFLFPEAFVFISENEERDQSFSKKLCSPWTKQQRTTLKLSTRNKRIRYKLDNSTGSKDLFKYWSSLVTTLALVPFNKFCYFYLFDHLCYDICIFDLLQNPVASLLMKPSQQQGYCTNNSKVLMRKSNITEYTLYQIPIGGIIGLACSTHDEIVLFKKLALKNS